MQRVVHTSTSEVYGMAPYVPIDERHLLLAQSPYASSKIGADRLVEAFRLSFGVSVVTVKSFNTFGPRQAGRAVTPTIVTQCLEGDVVGLGNIHPTRDLSYVTDTVDGFMLAESTLDLVGILPSGLQSTSVSRHISARRASLGRWSVARRAVSSKRRHSSCLSSMSEPDRWDG